MLENKAVSAEWLPFQNPCRATVNNPEIVKKIESLDAIYFTGGRPESLHYCLFGDVREPTQTTPALEAIKKLKLIAGSSAGSLIQPEFAILTTGYPSSYETLRTGQMTFSKKGTKILHRHVLVDVHFSERGRQVR
jgi:cyanophycinase-like exopeptidase